MNPILEKINQAAKMITKFTKAFEVTQAQALEDGVIDDDEKEELDELQAQISELDLVVKDHKKTLAANMAEWKGFAGDYTTFKIQVSELQERGAPDAPHFAEMADEIDRLEKEYYWKEASDNFQTAMAEIGPIYEESSRLDEVKTQSDAVEEFDSEKTAKIVDEFQRKNLAEQLERNKPAIKKVLEKKESENASFMTKILSAYADSVKKSNFPDAEAALDNVEEILEKDRKEFSLTDEQRADIMKELEQLEAEMDDIASDLEE